VSLHLPSILKVLQIGVLSFFLAMLAAFSTFRDEVLVFVGDAATELSCLRLQPLKLHEPYFWKLLHMTVLSLGSYGILEGVKFDETCGDARTDFGGVAVGRIDVVVID